MTGSVQIHCLVCEEPFDQLEGSFPNSPVGGAVLTFEAEVAGVASTRDTRQLHLRGYLCDDCIFAKGKNGLLHLVRTTVQHEYETWKPRAQ